MNLFLLTKQCVPLLTSQGELQEWFLWLVVPVAVFVVIPAVWRFLTGGKTMSDANARAVITAVGGSLFLLVVGWTMFQFFDPAC